MINHQPTKNLWISRNPIPHCVSHSLGPIILPNRAESPLHGELHHPKNQPAQHTIQQENCVCRRPRVRLGEAHPRLGELLRLPSPRRARTQFQDSLRLAQANSPSPGRGKAYVFGLILYKNPFFEFNHTLLPKNIRMSSISLINTLVHVKMNLLQTFYKMITKPQASAEPNFRTASGSPRRSSPGRGRAYIFGSILYKNPFFEFNHTLLQKHIHMSSISLINTLVHVKMNLLQTFYKMITKPQASA